MNWISYAERKPEPEPKRQLWVFTRIGTYDTVWVHNIGYGGNDITHWAEIEGPERRHFVSPTWPYVMEFAQRMERKLARNRHKGDRERWLGCDVRNLIAALKTELNEMEAEALAGNAEAAANECADVANFALMIADWYLTHAQVPPRHLPTDWAEIEGPEWTADAKEAKMIVDRELAKHRARKAEIEGPGEEERKFNECTHPDESVSCGRGVLWCSICGSFSVCEPGYPERAEKWLQPESVVLLNKPKPQWDDPPTPSVDGPKDLGTISPPTKSDPPPPDPFEEVDDATKEIVFRIVRSLADEIRNRKTP